MAANSDSNNDSNTDASSDSTDLARDAKGKFVAGNAGGPGRPPKAGGRTAIPARVLLDLAQPLYAPSVWMMANDFQAIDYELEKLRGKYPADVVAQVENRVALSRLAMRRLLKLLLED